MNAKPSPSPTRAPTAEREMTFHALTRAQSCTNWVRERTRRRAALASINIGGFCASPATAT
eukprot:2556794-Pyramimonas_sp.AAC.1